MSDEEPKESQRQMSKAAAEQKCFADNGFAEFEFPCEPGLHMVGTPPQMARLFEAKATARGQFRPIKRTKTVTVQPKPKADGKWPPKYTFDYAPLEEILDACTPALSSNGLDLFQYEAGGRMVSVLSHSGGGLLVHVTEISGFQRIGDIKAYGSAITYARRYAAGTLLGVAPEDDDDGNAASGDTVEAQHSRQKRSTPPEPKRTQKAQPAPKPAPEPEPKPAPEAPPEPKAPPAKPAEQEAPKPAPQAGNGKITEKTKADCRAELLRLREAGVMPSDRAGSNAWCEDSCDAAAGTKVYTQLTEDQGQKWLKALRATS